MVSVAAAALNTSRPPRVRITLSSSVAETVTLIRQHADGTTAAVRTPDGGPLILTGGGGVFNRIIDDIEAPYGQPLVYIASGAYSAPVTVEVTRPWLVSLGNPARSLPVTFAEAGSRNTEGKQGIFGPLGRKRPLVINGGPRSSPDGTLKLRTKTLGEADALDLILEDGAVLLLNVPDSLGWRIPTDYLSIGKVTEDRVVRYGAGPYRTWNLAYVTVDAPLGGSDALDTGPGGGGGAPVPPGTRTMNDLAVEITAKVGHAATMADAAATYATMAAAATGGG